MTAETERAAIPRDVLLYLVRLADWAAGQGFCHIDGLEDPDEWCCQMWERFGPADGEGYSAEALAQAIERGEHIKEHGND